MRGTKKLSKAPSVEGGAQPVDLVARVEALEAQVAELLAVGMIQRELSRLRAERKMAELEQQHHESEARLEAERAPKRLGHVRHFAEQRLLARPELSVATLTVWRAFVAWADRAQILDVFERPRGESELLDLLAGVLPAGVRPGETDELSNAGRPLPGLVGAGLVPDDLMVGDYDAQLAAEAERRRADDQANERRRQREADAQQVAVDRWETRQRAFAELARQGAARR